MTDPNKLRELAARVEKATGPDRELDASIFAGLGTHVLEKRGNDRRPWWYPLDGSVGRVDPSTGWMGGNRSIPRYTVSIDAATTLAPPECFYRSGHDGEGPDPAAFYCEALIVGLPLVRAVADTEPLARCVAFLRAQAKLLEQSQ